MYSRHPTTYPSKKGIYDEYSSQCGQPIEWATPRLTSSHKQRPSAPDVVPGGFPSRNLMMDKSFSAPSSPHLKHKGIGAEGHFYSKPTKPVKQVYTSSNSSYEIISSTKATLGKKPSDGADLAEMLAAQQELRMQGSMPGAENSSMRKMSSGLIDNNKGEHRGESSSTSYRKSVSPVQFATPFEGYHNMPYGSTAASVAYVAPQMRHDTHSIDGYVTPTGALSRPRTPSSTTSTDEDKLDSLIKAKDELIRQKDQIIERQKKSIQQLQQQQLSMDAKMQHMLMMKSCDQEGVVTVKLHEYQYEAAQLRAHLAQITADKNAEIDRLQKKLGESEYLLERMDACVKDTAAVRDKDTDVLQQQLARKDQTIADLDTKLESSKQELLSNKRRVDSLERYLSDVPTVEEHQKTSKTLKEVREECARFQDIITNKDKKLAQMNKAYGSKSEDLKKLHKQNKALKEKVESQEKSIEKFKSNGPVSEIEFEDMKMENERLQAELDRTKKVLEGKHKKMKAMHEQTQRDQKALEERLGQEENTVMALRDEINTRDKSTRELRKSIKEMASQMQDLMENNLNLKSLCDKYERCNSKEKADASKRLWSELSRCMSDLKAVVQLCISRKNGEDPNMSLLFGVKGNTTIADDFDDSGDDVDSLNNKILKIRDLQADVDALRTFISDQYAEDVGNNCTTQ